MKLTKHAYARMIERGISKDEIVQALQHGRIVERSVSNTGQPLAIVDHMIGEFRLRLVVDIAGKKIVSVVYKTASGRAE